MNERGGRLAALLLVTRDLVHHAGHELPSHYDLMVNTDSVAVASAAR